MNLIEERTVALAGVIQAASLVQSLARTGAWDEQAADSSLQSVLILDAMSTPAVFGGIEGVKIGLRHIADGMLASAQPEHVELLRYTMTLLQLQNQLYRDQDRFADFGTDVERLSAEPSERLIAACSDVYQQHISVMQPQIIVQGEQNYLQQDDIPPKVRAMLLAGLRAGVLWQQKGGGRFKILWERTRMQNAARSLLAMRH